jgi:hypothetical protein
MWIIRSKMVFIAHPKMASRSIRDTMLQLDAKQVGSHHAIDETALRVEAEDGASVGCVIRNPYDVMVSWHYHMTTRGNDRPRPPFPEWLADSLPKGNGYFEHGMFPGVKFADTILRFENLQACWKQWCIDCRVKYIPLPSTGVSQARDKRHYSTYYDAASRALVEEKFEEDLAFGEYEFEG